MGFHNQKLVKKLFVERKDNDIINRLNRTRTEPLVDLRAEREGYEKEVQVRRMLEGVKGERGRRE